MTTQTRPLARHLHALAAFADEWRTASLPPEADEFGRVLLLDSLGALVGATRYQPVRDLRAHLGSARVEDSVPFAHHLRLGAAATWLDSDSGGSFHPQGHRIPPVPTAHPGPHVLPVLLHHAARGVPDAELLRAFALSVEIGMRLGTATSLRPGLHPHGIHGTAAAAVAESLLLGHGRDLIAAALAHALTVPVAARLWQPMEGGTVRNVWTGLGAYYGAKAAAEAPWRAPTTPETVEASIAAVFTPDADLDLLSDRLGSRWVFLLSYLKPYACARWIHPALDATRLALGERDGEEARPESIDVETFAFAASLRAPEDLRTDLHARFDLPTCIATLILDGDLHAPAFLPERLGRREVAALRQRVLVREDLAYTAALPAERPTTVTITWSDGATTRGSVRNARGNPDDPLTMGEVAAKFRANVDGVLPDDITGACLEALVAGRAPEHGTLARVAGIVT